MNPNENYMNQMPLPGSQSKSGGVGPIIAVIIIIALVAFGGYYFWKQVEERRSSDRDINPELQSSDVNEVNAELQADLEAIQSDDLGENDSEEIEGEFN